MLKCGNVHLKWRNRVFGLRAVLGNQGHVASTSLLSTASPTQEGRVDFTGFNNILFKVLDIDGKDPVPCKPMAGVWWPTELISMAEE